MANIFDGICPEGSVDAYWREDDCGTRRNVEQLIWAGLVALLVHLIATLQWVVELIPQAKRLNIIGYLNLVTDLHQLRMFITINKSSFGA